MESIFPGLVAALLAAFVLPVLLVFFYRRFEYIELRPFLHGTVAGIVFLGIPLWFLGGIPFLAAMAQAPLYLVVLVLLAKGLLGEIGKKAVVIIKRQKKEGWGYYLPLGIGFFWGEMIAVLGPYLVPAPGTAVTNSAENGGTAYAWLRGLETGELAFFIVFLLAFLYTELAVTLLNGLSSNKSRPGLFFLCILLSSGFLAGAFFFRGHWMQWVFILACWLGSWVFSRYAKDVFSVFIKPGRSFKELKKLR